MNTIQDNSRVRHLNGYRLIYKPEHPSAMKSDNWIGFVYEHRYKIELELGRLLRDDEEVHHLDCDKSNNDLSNLIVLTKAMHRRLHNWIDNGATICENNSTNRVNSEKSKAYCKICNISLNKRQSNYCSKNCRNIDLKNKGIIKKPTKEELEPLLGTMSWVALGKHFNVSDNAVRKWAKSYNLL